MPASAGIPLFFVRHSLLLFSAFCLVLPARADDLSPAASRELLADPHFQNGVILLEPAPGKRVPYGRLEGLAANGSPTWNLAQWSSRFPLNGQDRESLGDGAIRFANRGKSVVFGRPGTPEADLSLAVKGSAEYGNRARRAGEFWPHLLVQTDFHPAPALTELGHARLHLEARLVSSQLFKTPDYTPRLHAAQFSVVFIVQNQNANSPGHGKQFWFALILYDDRYKIPPLHEAQDNGKPDASGMFVYTPASGTFSPRSLFGGGWVTIDRDLLPIMRTGLQRAWKHGFLNESHDASDYRITSLIAGWEMTGIFDAEVQLRNLSFRVTDQAP